MNRKRKRQALQDEMSDEDTTDITEKKNNVSKAPFAARKKKKKSHDSSTTSTTITDDSSCKVVVKQRVNHKKTMYLLEQLIVKHNMHEKNILLPYNKGGNLLSFKETSKPRGVEFILNKNTSAEMLSDFISKVLPCEKKKQGFNFTLEVAPICKYDLICLPKKMHQSMGSFGPLCLCERIQNDKIMLLDMQQLQLGEIDANTYFQIHMDSNNSNSNANANSGVPNYLFLPLKTSAQFVEYTVIGEMEDILLKKRDYCLGMVQVCKTSELGHSDSIKTVKCHFAHWLQSGDTVLGYDMSNSNISDANLEQYKQVSMEEVILVKKVEAVEKENRIFKLKNWKMQLDEDYEEFLNELENDPSLRQSILLYKNPQYEKKKPKKKQQEPHKIQLEELLDGMVL